MNTMNGKSIDEVILSCDKDGNGIIDYNEFKAAMLLDWMVTKSERKITYYFDQYIVWLYYTLSYIFSSNTILKFQWTLLCREL